MALATQSVLLVSASTAFQAPFALAVAVSVRYASYQTNTPCLINSTHSIGNLLGENKANRAGVAANTSIVMAVMIALFWSTLFLTFRKSWARMFNDDPGTFRFVSSGKYQPRYSLK